jgi:nucleoside-diphosphate-sugar epimerase
MAPRPLSPYALQKHVGEGYCRLFWQLYGLETVSLRYFNVFGPRQSPESDYAAVIPRFIVALLQGRPPVVFGDGEQSRDFVFVGDVVQANLLALSRGQVKGCPEF